MPSPVLEQVLQGAVTVLRGSGGVSCEAGVSGDAVILPGHVFGGGV